MLVCGTGVGALRQRTPIMNLQRSSVLGDCRYRDRSGHDKVAWKFFEDLEAAVSSLQFVDQNETKRHDWRKAFGHLFGNYINQTALFSGLRIRDWHPNESVCFRAYKHLALN